MVLISITVPIFYNIQLQTSKGKGFEFMEETHCREITITSIWDFNKNKVLLLMLFHMILTKSFNTGKHLCAFYREINNKWMVRLSIKRNG